MTDTALQIDDDIRSRFAGADDKLLYACQAFRDDLRHLFQGFDDWCALNRANLPEEYLKGNLRFAVKLNCAVGKIPQRQEPGRISSGGVGLHTQLVLAMIEPFNVSAHGRERRHNEFVLVGIVELVDRPEERLPVLVRLYFINDEVAKSVDGVVYRQYAVANNSGLAVDEIYPISVERKVALVRSGDFGGDVIEGGTQVVRDISDNDGNVRWQRLREHAEAYLAGLRLMLDSEFIGLSFQEVVDGPFQLLNVSVGPYGFKSGAFKHA